MSYVLENVRDFAVVAVPAGLAVVARNRVVRALLYTAVMKPLGVTPQERRRIVVDAVRRDLDIDGGGDTRRSRTRPGRRDNGAGPAGRGSGDRYRFHLALAA